MSDVTFDIANNTMQVCERHAEPWKVTLVDTGDATMTGGRLKRVAPHIRDEQSFCLTYGDGVANINITEEIAFHHQHGKLATVAAVQPPGRYGALQTTDARVTKFMEKPAGDGGLINGGFFVLSPKCLELIEGDDSSWEGGPLRELANQGELMAFEHHGFWQPMDTLRDKNQLEELWASGQAPWRIW
jgi:glucose-1-phosphate cytidylyltransferase